MLKTLSKHRPFRRGSLYRPNLLKLRRSASRGQRVALSARPRYLFCRSGHDFVVVSRQCSSSSLFRFRRKFRAAVVRTRKTELVKPFVDILMVVVYFTTCRNFSSSPLNLLSIFGFKKTWSGLSSPWVSPSLAKQNNFCDCFFGPF